MCRNESSSIKRTGVGGGLFVLTFLLPSGTLVAWNVPGHMVTAAIAYKELKAADPEALAKVIALLHDHPDFDEHWKNLVEDPDISAEEHDARLFMLAARWPDDVRETSQHRETWHYINLPYKPAAPIEPSPPSGGPANNIVAAFRRNVTILESDQNPGKRAKALSWIFHLIGDIHQPLHAAALVTEQFPEGDRGGTLFQVREWPTSSSIKLHYFWDDLVFNSTRFNKVREEADRLVSKAEHQRSALPELSEDSFAAWTKESFRLAVSEAYRNGTVKGTATDDEEEGEILPEDYRPKTTPVAQRRAVLAGYRLADLLKKTF